MGEILLVQHENVNCFPGLAAKRPRTSPGKNRQQRLRKSNSAKMRRETARQSPLQVEPALPQSNRSEDYLIGVCYGLSYSRNSCAKAVSLCYSDSNRQFTQSVLLQPGREVSGQLTAYVSVFQRNLAYLTDEPLGPISAIFF